MLSVWSFIIFGDFVCLVTKVLFKIFKHLTLIKLLKTSFAKSTSNVKKVNVLIFVPFLCTIFFPSTGFFIYISWKSSYSCFPHHPSPSFFYLKFWEFLELRQQLQCWKKAWYALQLVQTDGSQMSFAFSERFQYLHSEKCFVLLCSQFDCSTLILICLV